MQKRDGWARGVVEDLQAVLLGVGRPRGAPGSNKYALYYTIMIRIITIIIIIAIMIIILIILLLFIINMNCPPDSSNPESAQKQQLLQWQSRRLCVALALGTVSEK